MSMSQEEINALTESMKQLNEATTLMVQTLGAVTNQNTLAARSTSKLNAATKNSADKLDDLAEGSTKAKGALKNLQESTKKYNQQQDAMRDATRSAITSVTGFADALISGAKGFEKYSRSLTSAGDAAFELGKSFGGLGTVIGALAKASTIVVSKHLEQADAVFEARNELFKFAGAGSIGSNQLLDMAQALGFTEKQLDSLIKPLKSMGPSLLTLGDSAGKGATKFLEISKVSDEERKKFIRLGVMPEELLQSQADYINLQRLSGNQASLRLKTDKQIQQESLAYAESLKVISEMTGLEADEIKKRQEAVLNDFRFQAKMTQMESQAAALERAGKTTEAAEIRKVAENYRNSLKIASALSPELAEQAKSLILTGGNITEFTSNLAVAGVDTRKFAEAMESGDPDAILRLFQDVMDKTGDQAVRFGDQLGYLPDEVLKSLGLTPASMELLTKYQREGMSLAEAFAQARVDVENAGQQGNDTLADVQAERIAIEMKVAAGLSDLLQNSNLLMQGFNSTTIAVTALSAAAAVAALALGAIGLSRGARALMGRNGPSQTNQTTPRARIPRGVRGVGIAAAVVGTGLAVHQGMSTDAEIRRQRDEGEITTREARTARARNTGGTAGEVGGGLAGAAAGAKLGALAGAMTGPLAPALAPLGALIGGGIGYWMGSSAGRAAGETLGSTIAESTTSEMEDDISTATPELTATPAEQSTNNTGKMPWDDMVEFGEIKLSDNLTTNMEALTAFASAIKDMSDISGVKLGDGLVLPWDLIDDFVKNTYTDKDVKKIETNGEAVTAFANAIKDMPDVSGVNINFKKQVMPWDLVEDFVNKSFTDDNIAQIKTSGLAIEAFANAIKDMPDVSGVKTGGILFNRQDMPWDLVEDFSKKTLNKEKIESNGAAIAEFATAIKNMPELSINDDSIDSFDNLIDKLTSFTRLDSNKLQRNAQSLVQIANATSGVNESSINLDNLESDTQESSSFLGRRSTYGGGKYGYFNSNSDNKASVTGSYS
jgi:hypothetical protein